MPWKLGIKDFVALIMYQCGGTLENQEIVWAIDYTHEMDLVLNNRVVESLLINKYAENVLFSYTIDPSSLH